MVLRSVRLEIGSVNQGTNERWRELVSKKNLEQRSIIYRLYSKLAWRGRKGGGGDNNLNRKRI